MARLATLQCLKFCGGALSPHLFGVRVVPSEACHELTVATVSVAQELLLTPARRRWLWQGWKNRSDWDAHVM